MYCYSCIANMRANYEISKFPDFLNNSLGCRQVIIKGITLYSHTDGPGEGLEYGFDFMMFILAMTSNIQITMCCIREGFKEMKKHFSGHISNFFPCKMSIPYDPVSTAEIQQHLRVCIVHGQSESISLHPPFICQGFCHSFAQGDASVFYGMVFINMQVTLYIDLQIHFTMSGNLIQHMVKKTQTGMYFRLSVS